MQIVYFTRAYTAFLHLFVVKTIHCYTRSLSFSLDMGQGQPDDSTQPIVGQLPSLNTTRLIQKELDRTDVVLHIGDISYARGYAGVVCSIT